LNINKIIDKITENWIAKAVSIGLAVILFVFHRMTSLETRIITVPLTVQTSGGLVPASPYTRTIKVSLRGDAAAIVTIQEGDIEAYINMEKYETKGSYSAPVQIRKQGSALNVEPLELVVDPVEITLQLDHKISKYISLQANLRGNVEEGFEFMSHTLSPAEVIAEGPMSAMSGVSVLSTDIIDLSGRREDFSMMVSILTQDPLIVIRGTRTTEFKGFIRPSVSVRNIDGIPIVAKNLDQRFDVAIDRLGSVRLEGSRNDLDGFAARPDFLSIDCSGIRAPGEYTLPVSADLPEGLAIVRQEPPALTFVVSVKDEE